MSEIVQTFAQPSHVDIPARRPYRPASARAGEKGFVKRPEGFRDIQARAKSFGGTEHPKIVILAAIRSLRGLTPAESKVLAEAVDIVPRDDFTSPTAGVIWARNRVFAERCDLALSTVKKARRGLEQKGFAFRHIAGDNNGGHLDIRPFLADIDRHVADRIALDQQRHEDDLAGARFDTLDEEDLPRGIETAPQIQSSKTLCDSVPPSTRSVDADATRSSSFRRCQNTGGGPNTTTRQPQGSPTAVNCSPVGASGSFGRQPRGTGADEQPRSALLAAYSASTRWRALVSLQDIHHLAYDRLYAATAELIRQHFPDARRNHGETWAWAVRRHGWKAIVMAIVSLEDPDVRQPGRYFGWLVTKADGVDVGKNLAWLPKHIEERERRLDEGEIGPETSLDPVPLEKSPAQASTAAAADADTSEWQRFLQQLRRRVDQTPFRTFFAQLQYLDCRDGYLDLAAPNQSTANWLRDHYSHVIKAAAAAVNWPVRTVRIRGSS
jgi:hypothetical protein